MIGYKQNEANQCSPMAIGFVFSFGWRPMISTGTSALSAFAALWRTSRGIIGFVFSFCIFFVEQKGTEVGHRGAEAQRGFKLQASNI